MRLVSGADPMVAALLMVSRTLPFAVFAPLAGAFVDRFSRWHVLFWTDIARAVVALGFLFVKKPEDLWIAYSCSVLLAILTAFFEAAKNASLPNVTGDEGLLAGNALMFSSRFLLMMIGGGLGGYASAFFGYEIAFVINALSFVISACSIALIPAAELYRVRLPAIERESFFDEFRAGWKFMWRDSFVFTIILTNMVWAIGGGALNLIADRLGGVVFAGKINASPDLLIGTIMMTAGGGLFAGMMIARRVGDYVFEHNLSTPFIGWTLIIHGLLFAGVGLTGNFALVLILYFVSRLLLGVEYAVQETMLMRAIPDYMRGRVMTIDRAGEISIFSLSAYFSGVALQTISPQMLVVLTALISGSSGVIWFWRMRKRDSTIP